MSGVLSCLGHDPRTTRQQCFNKGNLARIVYENKRAVGRRGAPCMRGVAPGMNVLVKVGGALVGIPTLILAKGGTVVLVSRGG